MGSKKKVTLAFLYIAVFFSACRPYQECHTKNCNAVNISAFALSCIPTNTPFTDDFNIFVRKCSKNDISKEIPLTKNVFHMDVQSNDTNELFIGCCHIYCNAYGEPIYSIWEKSEKLEGLVSHGNKAFTYCALALSLYANSTFKHEVWNANISFEEKSDGVAVIILDLDKVGFETPLFVFKNGCCYHTHGE